MQKFLKERIRYYIRRLKRVIKKIHGRNKKPIMIGMLAVLIVFMAGHAIGASTEKKEAQKQKAELKAQLETTEAERDKVQQRFEKLQKEIGREVEIEDPETRPWNLVLVNFLHEMEEGYQPELAEVAPGYSLDVRAVEDAKRMLADAEKAGMNIIICSAYRSVDRQEQLFNESVRERLASGMSYYEAYKDAKMSVAVPGTSEHALGLALDLISNQYTELDEKQAETKEAQWLAENCHKYGFILRYPPEKTEITGIIYEPWHYRYVGVEDAARIMESGLTLEEYLDEVH